MMEVAVVDQSRDVLAQQLLSCAYDDLTDIQKSVIDLIATETPSGLHPSLRMDNRTFWDRTADRVAAIGGSWAFIAGFGIVLFAWMGLNIFLGLFHAAFDAYPFIFLNLMLSTLAAIQAPVIMMSQNRQSVKDRDAAEHDYVVNLRAELEILRLHDRLDALRDSEIVDILTAQNEVISALRADIAALKAR